MRNSKKWDSDVPVIVPWITDPFFSSIVTVSLFNFIKKLFVAHTQISVCLTLPPPPRMDPMNFRPWGKQSFNDVARSKAYRTSFIFADWCRERFFWTVLYKGLSTEYSAELFPRGSFQIQRCHPYLVTTSHNPRCPRLYFGTAPQNKEFLEKNKLLVLLLVSIQ